MGGDVDFYLATTATLDARGKAATIAVWSESCSYQPEFLTVNSESATMMGEVLVWWREERPKKKKSGRMWRCSDRAGRQVVGGGADQEAGLVNAWLLCVVHVRHHCNLVKINEDFFYLQHNADAEFDNSDPQTLKTSDSRSRHTLSSDRILNVTDFPSFSRTKQTQHWFISLNSMFSSYISITLEFL